MPHPFKSRRKVVRSPVKRTKEQSESDEINEFQGMDQYHSEMVLSHLYANHLIISYSYYCIVFLRLEEVHKNELVSN